MNNKSLIVLTNDDGVSREGIQTLYAFLKEKYRVIIIAPEREKSAGGHALTLHKPLRLNHISEDVYSVSGSPVDCINLAIKYVPTEYFSDFVISLPVLTRIKLERGMGDKKRSSNLKILATSS